MHLPGDPSRPTKYHFHNKALPFTKCNNYNCVPLYLPTSQIIYLASKRRHPWHCPLNSLCYTSIQENIYTCTEALYLRQSNFVPFRFPVTCLIIITHQREHSTLQHCSQRPLINNHRQGSWRLLGCGWGGSPTCACWTNITLCVKVIMLFEVIMKLNRQVYIYIASNTRNTKIL